MKIIKLKFIALALASFAAIGALFAPSAAFASTDPCDATLPAAIREANGCDAAASSGTLQNTIINILNVVIGISGLVAVVFIVIGGIQYMTAIGDAGKIKKAKDTILYALIGIIVCALALAIVNWVIVGALGDGSTPAPEATPSTPGSLLLPSESSDSHFI